MGEGLKRPRISKILPPGTGIVKDELEYVANKTSDLSRRIRNVSTRIIFEIHYEKRFFIISSG
jgi:hypothetical protein